LIRAPHQTAAREPREKGWRRVVFRGPDGEQIELRG
jgi:lactoylglutathione lyase